MLSQVKVFLYSDKRAVSIMVGYVLLVTSAIIMGVVVYQWIRTYVPTEALECPDGVSIFLKEYSYDCSLEELSITLKNNGRFNLAGYFIHATNNSNQTLATIDLSNYTPLGEGKGGTVLFIGTTNSFEPSDEPIIHTFDLSDSGIGQVYSVEIIPVRFQEEEGKTRFASCGNAKVEEIINCGTGEGSCSPTCIGKECGSDGCDGSCPPGCEGEEFCDEGTCELPPEGCGDNSCDSGEDCWNCEEDCGDCCGDGSCDLEYDENCETCLTDCGCGLGYVCEDGECVEECISHSYTQCYDNDIYWYDSCDVREEPFKEDCGESGYDGGNYCYNNDVYRNYVTRECSVSGPECTSSTERELQEECGVMGCRNGECRTVICTELYNLGYLTEEEYKIELKYGATHFSPEEMRGYHAFAIPAVKAIRKNPKTIENILPLVKSFTEEMAYRLGEKDIGNEVGELFLDKGIPLFERIGILINEPDWQSLFNENYQDTNPILQNEKYDNIVKDSFTEEKIKEMFYDSLKRSEGSDILFAYNLLENLEKVVEEIELKVSLLRHPDLLLI